MRQQRFIVLLLAAFIAISAALYFSTQRNLPRDQNGLPLFPSLNDELNSVTSLNVRKGGATPVVTIERKGDIWSVAQRADYPADVSKLRRLLLALSEAKIVEQKTSNPANFSIIGVEDPAQPGAGSAQVDLTAKDGKHSVIIGKPVGQGNFVRRTAENTSYIVEPGISFEAEPRFWIDSRLIDLPVAKIQRIEVKPPGDGAYSVQRTVPSVPLNKRGSGGTAANPDTATNAEAATAVSAATSPGEANFSLNGVPSGRTAAEPQALAPSPTTFSNLTADDVAAADSIDFSKPSNVTVTLSDGNVITFTGIAAGDKRWLQVAASEDAALTAKSKGRAFEISNFRYDAIFRPIEQLLVPKPAPAPPGAKLPHKPAPTKSPAPAS